MNWLISGGIVLVALGIVFVPIAAIWSVNLLFGFAIPYTIKTWAASLILSGIVSGSTASTGK